MVSAFIYLLSVFLCLLPLPLLRIMYVLVLVAVVCWIALDTALRGTRQLVSFTGLLLLIFLMLLFSKHPFRVRDAQVYFYMNTNQFFDTNRACLLQWSGQTLLCGTGLQFIFGLLILRTSFGLRALEWLGNQAEVYIYKHTHKWFVSVACQFPSTPAAYTSTGCN